MRVFILIVSVLLFTAKKNIRLIADVLLKLVTITTLPIPQLELNSIVSLLL